MPSTMRSAPPANRASRCRWTPPPPPRTSCEPSMVIEICVVETRGSAPREAGTRMWVGAAEVRGTIGGGNLEYTALKIAREMLLSGEKARERRFALGDSLGQCCGGAVTLRFVRKSNIEKEAESAFTVALFGAGHVG